MFPDNKKFLNDILPLFAHVKTSAIIFVVFVHFYKCKSCSSDSKALSLKFHQLCQKEFTLWCGDGTIYILR